MITALLHDEAEKKLFASPREKPSLESLVRNLSGALSKITCEGETPAEALIAFVHVGSCAVAEMARLTSGEGRSNPVAFSLKRVNDNANPMMSSEPEMSPTLRMAVTGHAMIEKLGEIQNPRKTDSALLDIAAMAVCCLRMHREQLAPLVTTTPGARCGDRDIYSLKHPPRGKPILKQGVLWYGQGAPPPFPEI